MRLVQNKHTNIIDTFIDQLDVKNEPENIRILAGLVQSLAKTNNVDIEELQLLVIMIKKEIYSTTPR